ncbi:MAG: TetR/AcrR family transcriptional regulator [Candidatus Puniceispirillaceae bacterium]
MARTVGSNGEETAARIRACALELIARQGFEAMSMRGLAAAVGVQSAALYHHFATKQALLADLMISHMRDLLAAWQNACPDHLAGQAATAPDRLDAFARFHIRYHISRPQEVFIAYMELRSLSPAHYSAVSELRRAYENLLKAILQDGVDDGSFQIDDIHVTAMAILAMLTGITTWYRPGGRLSASAVEMQYAAMVRRMAVGEIGESLPVPRQANQ